MHTVQQLQRLGLQVKNSVLLAPQEEEEDIYLAIHKSG